MALIAGSKQASDFALKNVTPYGAMGLHLDNANLPAAKKLLKGLYGHGESYINNKAALKEWEAFAWRPDNHALAQKAEKFYLNNQTTLEMADLYSKLQEQGEALHNAKNLFKLSDLPAGFLEKSLF